MTDGHYRFSTERLEVGEWHALSSRHDLELLSVIGHVLTSATTATLPPEWRGDFDDHRAAQWLRQRDAESPTLLVVNRSSAQAVGLLIVFETATADDLNDLRVGYVLAEEAWGRGLATELVGGLVEWAGSEPRIRSLSGGVAEENHASERVLLENGFEPVGLADGVRLYRRTLR